MEYNTRIESSTGVLAFVIPRRRSMDIEFDGRTSCDCSRAIRNVHFSNSRFFNPGFKNPDENRGS